MLWDERKGKGLGLRVSVGGRGVIEQRSVMEEGRGLLAVLVRC